MRALIIGLFVLVGCGQEGVEYTIPELSANAIEVVPQPSAVVTTHQVRTLAMGRFGHHHFDGLRILGPVVNVASVKVIEQAMYWVEFVEPVDQGSIAIVTANGNRPVFATATIGAGNGVQVWIRRVDPDGVVDVRGTFSLLVLGAHTGVGAGL